MQETVFTDEINYRVQEIESNNKVVILITEEVNGEVNDVTGWLLDGKLKNINQDKPQHIIDRHYPKACKYTMYKLNN